MSELNVADLEPGDELRHISTGTVVEIKGFKEQKTFDGTELLIIVGGNANWTAPRIWEDDRDDWEAV